MVLLGFFLGIGFMLGLGLLVWGWWGLTRPLSSYSARAAIRDLERRTIHELLSAELDVRRSRAAGALHLEHIEGTASEVEPS